MKEAEAEQQLVDTMSKLKIFYKKRIQRVRNVTWRLAYIGAYVQSLLVLLLPTLDNIFVILLMSAFIVLKSVIGFRNFHLEDLGSGLVDTISDLKTNDTKYQQI
jgi:hypothetical protein